MPPLFDRIPLTDSTEYHLLIRPNTNPEYQPPFRQNTTPLILYCSPSECHHLHHRGKNKEDIIIIIITYLLQNVSQ